MTQAQIDKLIAFTTGDLVVMMAAWIHLDVLTFALKLGMTITLGLFGGAAGMAGKDIYNWIKQKLNNETRS